MQVMQGLTPIIAGKIEASATRRRSTPRTRSVGIDNCEGVRRCTHAAGPSWVIDGVRRPTGIFRQILVILNGKPGSELSLDPRSQCRLLSDLASQLDPSQHDALVAAIWVGKVTEIDKRRNEGVSRPQPHYTLALGMGDVRRQTKRILGSRVAERHGVDVKGNGPEMIHQVSPLERGVSA